MTTRSAMAALLTLIGALATAACGDKGIDRIPAAASLTLGPLPTVTTTTGVPVPTAPVLQPSSGGLHAIGERVATASGNTVVVHAWDPAVAGVAAQVAGGTVVAADVEACAGRVAASPGPAQFALELATGALVGPMAGGRAPAFAAADLRPGACARGWISFTLPPGAAPADILFRGSSVIRWSLA